MIKTQIQEESHNWMGLANAALKFQFILMSSNLSKYQFSEALKESDTPLSADEQILLLLSLMVNRDEACKISEDLKKDVTSSSFPLNSSSIFISDLFAKAIKGSIIEKELGYKISELFRSLTPEIIDEMTDVAPHFSDILQRSNLDMLAKPHKDCPFPAC